MRLVATFLIGKHHQFWCWAHILAVGHVWQGFGWGKYIFRVYYANKNLSHPFRSHRGAGQGGWQEVRLDDTAFPPSLLGNITRFGARVPSLLGTVSGCFGWVKLYYGSSILIKNYPTPSAAIGGWDGVDANQTHLDVARLHLPFWETSPGFGFSEERCIE